MYPKGSIMKQIKILFLAIALWGSMGTFAQATTLASDQFTSSDLDGYTGSGISWYQDEGGWMDIDHDATASKTNSNFDIFLL